MPTTKKTASKNSTLEKTVAPKKAVAKKVNPKKAISKKVAPKKVAGVKSKKVLSKQKPLLVADDARSFWVADGKILNSLVALQSALAEMESAVYSHHVTDTKNDFALWVDHVLCDKTCARALSKAKTPYAAQTIISKHLKSYQL